MEVTGALSIKPSGNISLSTLTSVMTQPPSSPQPPIHEKDDLIPVSAGRHFLRRPNIPLPPLSLLCCCLHTTSCLSRVGQRSAQTAFRLCRHRSFHSYPTFVFFHQDHKKKKNLGHHQDLTDSDTYRYSYRRYSPLSDAKNNKHDVTRCLKSKLYCTLLCFI